MKKRLMMIGLVMLTMAGTVQGQGFLKKLGSAVDKATKKVEKAIGGITDGSSKTKSAKQEAPTSTSTSNTNDEDDELDGPKSNLYEAMSHGYENVRKNLDKITTFRTTANTKVVELDNMDGIQLGYFSDGRAFVEAGNVMMCIDTQGNVLKKWPSGLDSNFETGSYQFPHFSSGRIIAYEEGGISLQHTAIIYDTDFNVIKKIPDVQGYTYFENGIALLQTETNTNRRTMLLRDVREELKFIDVNGNQVLKHLTDPMTTGMGRLTIKDEISYGRPLRDGLIAYFAPKDEFDYKWGFRDANGKVVIPAKYDVVQDFSNGLAAVGTRDESGIKWGFIDTKGNMVIAQKFSNTPSNFDACGLALVKDRDFKFVYINKQGEVVSEKYGSATPFCNGQAIVREDGKGMKLINSKFETIAYLSNSMDISFDANQEGRLSCYFNVDMPAGGPHRGMFYDGQIYLFAESNYCLLDKDGNVKMYGLKGPFVNGIAPVEKWKNMQECEGIGYVNEQGEWIVKFERSQF